MTTNAEIKKSLDGLNHRFDLFEQKEETRLEKIECEITDIKHDIYGNSKEGIKQKLQTLWEQHCKGEKRSDTIWIGVAMIVINAVFNLILK
jgi:hypothetical protein